MTSKPLRPNKTVLGTVVMTGLVLLSGCAPVGDAVAGTFLQDLLLSATAAFLL